MVKCPVCRKDINELDESCPYCHIVFDDDINEDVQETEDLKTNLEEISDITLEETNLSDLGLDESYTEPDVLEIMDLENDVKEEAVEESDESSISQGLVSKNVEKIKALIEELKASGVDIELEEFAYLNSNNCFN